MPEMQPPNPADFQPEGGETTEDTPEGDPQVEEPQTKPDESQTEPEAEPETPEVEPEADEDPPTRKTKQDYIIERLAKKKDKLKKEVEELRQKAGEGKDNDKFSDVDEYIKEKYGDKLEMLDKLAEQTEEQEIRQEVEDFVRDNPDFEKYQKKILKYATHPSRKHLPVSSVAYEVAGNDLLQIGAKRAAEVKAKANKTKTGTSLSGADGGEPDWNSMSQKEFEKYTQKVLQQL
jgi:hypothetical protein